MKVRIDSYFDFIMKVYEKVVSDRRASVLMHVDNRRPWTKRHPKCACVIYYFLDFFQITNLMHNSFILQQYVCYTTILNMFRAARSSSSGGQIVSPQPLVSSPSVNSRTVCSQHTYCWKIKELCITLVIWKSLYYAARSEKHQISERTVASPWQQQFRERTTM